MEEQQQQQQVQVVQPHHLKCPRCDSSNTKFCYYNNYSLSQPRHLCKSCKRYWTRGGTLRNVPVGGKCRKNKTCSRSRDKQSSSSTGREISSSMQAAVKTSTTVQSSSLLQVDVSSSSTTRTHINNPLFSQRDGKDLSFPQFCDELGFLTSQKLKPGDDHTDVAISNQVFSGYPLFGISSSTTCSTGTNSTMAFIIASSLEQQQNSMVFNGGFKGSDDRNQTPAAYGFLDLDDVQMMRNDEAGFQLANKYARMEGAHNRNTATTNYQQNYVDQEMKFSSDPPFMWNSSAAWLDSSNNIGSSVPSLI